MLSLIGEHPTDNRRGLTLPTHSTPKRKKNAYIPLTPLSSQENFKMKFNIPTRENQKLRKLIEKVEGMKELETLWHCSNITAIDRMGYTDHGPVHVRIISNIALKLARMLESVEMHGVEKDYKLPSEYSKIIIFLSCILHDIGMVVQREKHEIYAAVMAYPLLEKILSDYPVEERVIITSEVLHAIVSHYSEGKPLTKEAAIFCIADALDMEKGRARIPFDAGKVDIHSVSALAIDQVEFLKGDKKPVTIKIKMSNSAGIFQVDELLGSRIRRSGMGQYIDVIAEIEGETEKKILKKFEL